MRYVFAALVALVAGAQAARAEFDGIVRVPNNAALAALKSTQAAWVERLGFTTIGDAEKVLYASSNSACSLNAGAGDNGSQVASADSKCWIATFPAVGASVGEWGAVDLGSGNVTGTDSSTALDAAAAWCGRVTGGGRLLIGNHRYAHDSAANWVVPQGCTVASSGPVAGDPATNPVNWASTTGGAILINPTKTVSLSGNLDGVLVAPYGMGPAASGQAYYQQVLTFAGTGITIGADHAVITHSGVVGFAQGISSTGFARLIMDDVLIDDTAGLLLANSYDVAHISKVHGWSWTGGNVNNIPFDVEAITGVANNGSGLVRLTVTSTTDLATGNNVSIEGVGGAVGANGDTWTITVIDSTHVDLQGSAFAGLTHTCSWGSTDNAISCTTIQGINPGGAVSGTNIQSGTTVMAVDPINNRVWLSNYPTAAGSSVTLTFALGTYTSGGDLVLNGTRRSGAFVKVTGGTQNDFHDMFEYGYKKGYYVSTNSLWNFFHDASCDALIEGNFVTTDSCIYLDANAHENEFIGGQIGGSTIGVDEQTTGGNTVNQVIGLNFRNQASDLSVIVAGVGTDFLRLDGIATNLGTGYVAGYFGQNFTLDGLGAVAGLLLVEEQDGTAGVAVPAATLSGTWTPTVLLNGVPSSGMTFSTSPTGHFRIDQYGYMMVDFGFQLSALGSGTGNLQLGNMPLNCVPGIDDFGLAPVFHFGNGTTPTTGLTGPVWGSATGNANYFAFTESDTAINANSQPVTNANITSSLQTGGTFACRTR
ncbi:MAG TPA: hypothetical protein VMS01_04165 [Stellaceae bacterium]|nr:hypothetical protein [Stellaceae bacterium]